jgi:hypothetical protein
MKISVKTKNDIPTLEVTEGDVTCTLKLQKNNHHVKVDGEDENSLCERLMYSYRLSFGKGCAGIDFLKLIKKDLLERERRKETKE